MRNVIRVLAVLLVAGLGLSGVAVWRARERALDPAAAPTLGALYAAPVEKVSTHVMTRGETLSAILENAAFTRGEAAGLLLGVREHVNPRRLTEGVEVTVRRWAHNDSARTVDVRVNADVTVRLQHDEVGWASRLMVTPVVFDTVYVAGTIDAGRTLYDAITLDAQSELPLEERDGLVNALADIYEYKLDFTRQIQPGDAYRLAYERQARPDGTARERRILAAEIVSRGRTFPAVWFARNTELRGYYDLNGRPLREGFSRYPVEYRRISSRFNRRRYHPILGVYRAHLGTDFAARSGTPVRSTASGTVISAGRSGGYGNLIRIRHISGYETRYAHLSRFARGVRAGKKVTERQVIGYVGATGLATAPHLHYELRRNGRAFNAQNARLPGAPPLARKDLVAFKELLPARIAMLEDATRRYAAARANAESRNAAPDGS